jgi:hypothetical protein
VFQNGFCAFHILIHHDELRYFETVCPRFSHCITFCTVLYILALNFLIKGTFCLLIIVSLKLLFVDCHVFAPSTVFFLGGEGNFRMLYSEKFINIRSSKTLLLARLLIPLPHSLCIKVKL